MRRVCRLVQLIALLIACGPSLWSQEPEGAGIAVDAYLQRLEAHGFSGAAVVARGRTVLLEKGYGFADLKSGKPVRPDRTVFDLSSLDKQFIAAGVMKLAMMGKLQVTDPVSKYFSGVPAERAGITIRQLLSHTSGIDDVYWDQHATMSESEFNHWVLTESRLVAPPGSRWRYSNANFWLLEEVIAQASGQPFEQFMREKIFAPAGMQHTGTFLPKWNAADVSHPRHLTLEPWRFGTLDYGDLLHRPTYLKTMLSTADDLLRWYWALRETAVLSAAAKVEMFAPVLRGYGYGWYASHSALGRQLVHHGGAGEGAGMRVTFRYFPEDDVFFTVLSASVNPDYSADNLGADLESLIFGGNVTMPPSGVVSGAPLPNGIEGTYRFDDGSTFELRSVRGRLVLFTADEKAIGQIGFTSMMVPRESVTQDVGALRILDAVRAGSLEPVTTLIAEGVNVPAMQEDLTEEWKRGAQLGAYRYATTTHRRVSAYAGEREDQSFVAAVFEHGALYFRFIHGLDNRYEADPIHLDGGFETVLARQPDGAFSLWNATLGLQLRLTFAPASASEPARITIADRTAKAVATRR